MDWTSALTSLSELGMVLRPLITAVSVLAGLTMFAMAARALLKGSGNQQDGPNLMAVGIHIFVGAALIQLARSIEDTRTGLLAGAGSEVRSMMTYGGAGAGGGGGGGFWGLLLTTCFIWIATIGAIGVMRGFMLWDKAGGGESQRGDSDYFWRGLWHILGGAICINIGA